MERRSEWNHYDYVYGDGLKASVAFDVMAAIMPGDAGFCVRVVGADGALLDTALAGADGLLVGELSYHGKEERVVHMDEPPVRPLLERLEAAGATVEVTDGWDYFTDRVSPNPADWRRIEDREALERLDLDGDGELRVMHRFYGGSEGLAVVKERLMPEGFELVAEESERLTLAHVHKMGDISTITLGLLRLCEHTGVAYDGWVLPG